MTEFCQEHEIIHKVTTPYTPQSNGVTERKNKTLMDMMNSMLLSSGALENLRGEAFFLLVTFSIGFLVRSQILLLINFGRIEPQELTI